MASLTWKHLLLLLGVLALTVPFVVSRGNKTAKSERNGKLLSLFNVVKFPNEPCGGTSNKNGTCYTPQECEDRDGTNSGSCAEGYGVCCTFVFGCGKTSKENCTYFESQGSPTGSCRSTICKNNMDVCQLRLDFETFIITGPSTDTNSIGKALNGVLGTGGKSVSGNSRCTTDSFSVSASNGNSPPVICGTNTGEHMYVEASEDCNTLSFDLFSDITTATSTPKGSGISPIAARQWSIKVTQIPCGFVNKAPQGCTQWFFGGDVGTVKSYNFEGGHHLANQRQIVCVRREKDNCRICWTAVEKTDVQTSGTKSNKVHNTLCCGYGEAGDKESGYDCLIIPGALNTKNTKLAPASRQCGRSAGLVSASGAIAVTVCSDLLPFKITFLSDNFEFTTKEATKIATGEKGFKLSYIQTSTGC